MSLSPWKYSSVEIAPSVKLSRLKNRAKNIPHSWCSQLSAMGKEEACVLAFSFSCLYHYVLLSKHILQTITTTSVDSERHDRHGHSILFLTTFYYFKNKPFAQDQSLIPFTELFILLILLNGFYTGSYFSFVLYQKSLVHLTQHYLGLKVLWISVSNTTYKPTQRQVIEGSQYILLYRGRVYQS